MIESLRARVIITVMSLLVAVIWMVPNVFNMDKSWWFSKDKLNYGLDIQGGLHLVLKVDVDSILQEKTTRQTRTVSEDLGKEKIAFKKVIPSTEHETEFFVEVDGESQAQAVKKFIDEKYGRDLQVLGTDSNRVRVRYLDLTVSNIRKQVIDQTIEVLRGRVDELGVSEPSITAQGENRVLVQLPGLENAAYAKKVINKTARLEFRIVNDEFDFEKLSSLISEAEKKGNYAFSDEGMKYTSYLKRLNEDLRDELPKGWVLVFERAPSAKTMDAGKIPYLVTDSASLTGDLLDDAYVGSGEYGEPEVIFSFNVEGRRKFSEITGNNIKKRMAIILDGKIKSAPVIQGKIDSPTARITLGASNYEETVQEAQLIATSLRAGALPAQLEQLEERTVGPTLGADSIRKGKMAGIIGGVLVFLFMLIYYRKLGIVANLALSINVLMLLAVLTSLGATLTLPGVAGIVLTMGMAVDANIIIFERIKEELAKGAGVKSAIKDGFGNAFSAIFDSNITTAAVCVVLMYFGTGAVRGFAVTLICGIVTSMFTAIFVSRTIFEIMINKMNVKKLLA